MSFKAPDVTAPRARLKAYTVDDQAFYNNFKKSHPDFISYSNSDLREIVNTFNTEIWKQVISSKDGVELPEALGYIFIGACDRPRTTIIDFKKSKELDTNIPHRNFESDNRLAKIFFTNYTSKYKYKFRSMWAFSPCRRFTREVSKNFKTLWNTYLQINTKERVSQYISNDIYMNKTVLSVPPQDYNEFDIN